MGGCYHLANYVWGRFLSCGQNRRTLVKRDVRPKRVVHRRQDVEYKERRRGPRYPFIASAELIEQKADVRIASRVSEVSQNGCYLDMMNPFPQGTMVLDRKSVV